ncbi:pilin [Candidatus Gracilibacteria bacterium]|nr:pilin [Candidatus Gracilibacteria bacterium]
MMQKLSAPILSLLAVFGVLTFDSGSTASAALIGPADNPPNIEDSTVWSGSARQAIREIVNYFLFFLGLIATIMVIYGGFLYITSGGDDSGAEKGKKILIYAAIGIVVILISYALVNTLIGAGMGGEPPAAG